MKLRTFKLGGVHPPENKITAAIPVVPVDLPKQVSVTLSQHLGVPAEPSVEKGAKVKVGTLIGEAKGFISANIHSPVSGTVLKIDGVTDASGYRQNSVVINVEGDEWEEKIDRSDKLVKDIKLSPEEIIQRIGDIIYGYLFFGHAFQECGLHFGTGAVYFVGQYHMSKNGTMHKSELTGPWFEDIYSQNITGQHIRSKLNAPKSQNMVAAFVLFVFGNQFAECLCKSGFSGSGIVFQ